MSLSCPLRVAKQLPARRTWTRLRAIVASLSSLCVWGGEERRAATWVRGWSDGLGRPSQTDRASVRAHLLLMLHELSQIRALLCICALDGLYLHFELSERGVALLNPLGSLQQRDSALFALSRHLNEAMSELVHNPSESRTRGREEEERTDLLLHRLRFCRDSSRQGARSAPPAVLRHSSEF